MPHFTSHQQRVLKAHFGIGRNLVIHELSVHCEGAQTTHHTTKQQWPLHCTRIAVCSSVVLILNAFFSRRLRLPLGSTRREEGELKFRSLPNAGFKDSPDKYMQCSM